MPALPLLAMDKICSFGIPIRIVAPKGSDGNVSLLELIVINHMVAQWAPAAIFELGTFDGRTTLNLAANAPDGTEVFTIDLPRSQVESTGLDLDPNDRSYIEKEISGGRFLSNIESQKINQLLGDTAKFDFSPWHNQIDFVFIDASHSASYVENDTEIALKLIGDRVSGIIVWHDYNAWPGVTTVLDRYRSTDPRLKHLIHIPGTTLAICTPRVAELADMANATRRQDEELTIAYWQRYPDVAANSYYGEQGRLGIAGARQHFEEFGRAEGRIWHHN